MARAHSSPCSTVTATRHSCRWACRRKASAAGVTPTMRGVFPKIRSCASSIRISHLSSMAAMRGVLAESLLVSSWSPVVKFRPDGLSLYKGGPLPPPVVETCVQHAQVQSSRSCSVVARSIRTKEEERR